MSVSSPATPIHLTWVKCRIKGRHELSANGPILGSLQRVSLWKSATQAEFKGRTWSFQRCGFSRTGIMEEPGARPVAAFKNNWLGGGMLIFSDGESFQLTAKGFWRPVWSWLDREGKRLFEVVPHEKTVRVTGTAAVAEARNSAQDPHSRAVFAREWAEAEGKLPVLIMFSWHQILETNDNAAAAAAISAAAG